MDRLMKLFSTSLSLLILSACGSSFEIDFGGNGDDRVYPTVTTLPAENVLPHSALLQGTFNPNGTETTAYFKWGGDPTLLDNIEAWGASGTGTSTINFSEEISQLSSDTQYYFKLYAYTDEYAGASGAILNFKTPYELDMYWARTYGGSENEYPGMISLTLDGGYLLTSWTHSLITGEHDDQPNTDLWVIKLDSEGRIVWQKQYRELPFFVSGGSFGIQLSNGEFIVAANRYRSIDNQITTDPWLIKLGATGSIIWQKSFDKGHIESLINDGGDNLLVAGFYLDEAGMNDYWLMKLNNAGEVLWQKSYGTGQTDDRIGSIVQTVDGYMVAGSMDGRSWLLEVDEAGNVLWQKLYSCNNAIAIDLPIKRVAYDSSDGYTLIGSSYRLLVAKVGLNGAVQWVRNYGLGKGNAIVRSNDGSHIFGGQVENKNGLIKIDENGDIIWSKLYGTRKGTVTSLRAEVNNDIIFASVYEKAYDDNDIQVIKLPANGVLSPITMDIALTPEDMVCSFQEDTFVSASATSSAASSTSASVLNTYATVLQQSP